MATYQIEVIETLSRIIEVEADNIEDATSDVNQQYSDGDIVLDSDDLSGYEIAQFTE